MRVNGIHKSVGQKGCNYSMLHEESESRIKFELDKNKFDCSWKYNPLSGAFQGRKGFIQAHRDVKPYASKIQS